MRTGLSKKCMLMLFLLLLMCAMNCEREVWETRSPEEIEALNEVIRPLPDSMLAIPDFDGKHTIPVVQFSFDHFTESWKFTIFNNGSCFCNNTLVRKFAQRDIKDIISKLNQKGLFDISEGGIMFKLAGPRKMNFFELLLPPPSRPHVPIPVIDGGIFTIQVTTKHLDYYIRFYAIEMYVMEFPMCQDIQILYESIGYLRDIFWGPVRN